MTNTERMAQTIETAKANHANTTGSGLPWRHSVRIINGHRVQANIFGWDTQAAPVMWIDGSTEPLTITDALARIAE